MFTLMHGDCLDILQDLPAESYDSLVTDPPAGISFMGKDWDHHKGGRDEWIAWMTKVMKQCFRVMKPGAHGFVWALPRTSHWTATALEDAGFDIRDVVMHVFGQGFPKSLDVSKAIDKAAGAEREKIGEYQFPDGSKRVTDRTSSERVQQLHGNKHTPITAPSTPDAKKWEGWGTALKPAWEGWILCRKPIESEKSSEKMVTFNAQEWEETFLSTETLWRNIWDVVLSPQNTSTIKTVNDLTTALRTLKCSIFGLTQAIITLGEIEINGSRLPVDTVVTNLKRNAAMLDDLKRISASGNATSIADISRELIETSQKTGPEISQDVLSEHWILVRKPLGEKTVAKNVLKHGTGAINIDASRVEIPENDPNDRPGEKVINKEPNSIFGVGCKRGKFIQGRFPSNFICSAREMLDEQSGVLKRGGDCTNSGFQNQYVGGKVSNIVPTSKPRDSGGASRFFYCAKASKKERGENNGHPTVKAQKLMRYLTKMITPPGGKVLDPFMGSGSTGVAALSEGFEFLGVEAEKEYLDIAERRLLFS